MKPTKLKSNFWRLGALAARFLVCDHECS